MFAPPNDLEPLYPGVINVDTIRTALWFANGSIPGAAELLGSEVWRVRRYCGVSELLFQTRCEIAEQLLDRSEQAVHEAVHSSELKRAFPMAQFVLTHLRNDRGWMTNGNRLVLQG